MIAVEHNVEINISKNTEKETINIGEINGKEVKKTKIHYKNNNGKINAL